MRIATGEIAESAVHDGKDAPAFAESDAYVEKRKAWGQATANVDGLFAKLKVIGRSKLAGSLSRPTLGFPANIRERAHSG
jgi:hypothetical protein